MPQKAAVFFPNFCRNHCHRGMLTTADTWQHTKQTHEKTTTTITHTSNNSNTYVEKNCQMHKQQVATHQDGQHDILEVFPQVGGVCAEEDKIVLHQLHTTSKKESHEIAAPNVTEIERGICSPLIRRPARDPLASIGPAFFFLPEWPPGWRGRRQWEWGMARDASPWWSRGGTESASPSLVRMDLDKNQDSTCLIIFVNIYR